MNKTELEKYKAMLLAKQADLSRGLHNREDIAIQKAPDALDEVQLAVNANWPSATWTGNPACCVAFAPHLPA